MAAPHKGDTTGASCTSAFQLDVHQRTLGTAAALIGATVSCVAVLFVGDCLGRRRELMLAGTLYLTGSVASALVPTTSFPSLVAARCLFGLGVGFAMHGAPTYISEITPAPQR